MRLSLIVLLFISIPFLYAFQKGKNKQHTKRDVAYKMCCYELEELRVCSLVDVPCIGFENRKDVFRYWVEDSTKIQALLVQLVKAKPAPEFGNSIATTGRKLIIYYRSGRMDFICMSSVHTILFNGISMQLPTEEFGWDDFYKVIGGKRVPIMKPF